MIEHDDSVTSVGDSVEDDGKTPCMPWMLLTPYQGISIEVLSNSWIFKGIPGYAMHKTTTIWSLMLKYFLSFKSIFARLKSKQRMMLKSKLRWMLKSKQRIMLKSKLRRKLISITYICQSIMLCIIRLDLLRAFSHKSKC